MAVNCNDSVLISVCVPGCVLIRAAETRACAIVQQQPRSALYTVDTGSIIVGCCMLYNVETLKLGLDGRSTQWFASSDGYLALFLVFQPQVWVFKTTTCEE